MSHLSLFQTSCGLGLQCEDFSTSICSKMFQQTHRDGSEEESVDMNDLESTRMRTEPRNSTTHKPRKDNLGDRFIPFRNNKRMEVGSFLLSSQESSTSQEEDSSYSKLITEGLINTPLKNEGKLFKTDVRINQFRHSSSMPANLTDQLSFLYDKTSKNFQAKKPPRTLPQNPEKILDAPELVNDYYLNLLDWGNNNVLAVCLGQSVYLWNAVNSEINQLLTTKESDSYVSSVAWSTRSNVVAVGSSTNLIQVWDAEKGALVRNVYGHDQRVSSLNWNGCILSSGSRDATIINHDLRMPNHIINRYIHHSSEVCGLKWSPDGSQLASGANDNTLMIWDLSYNTPRHILREHTAAVKAVAWCPWQKNLLASGGGTNDKTIKFWNTDAGCMVQSLNCNTQVCSLIWNPNEKEIVSSHGFSSATEDNSKSYIRVWKYPSMSIVGELKGHEDRVLHLALSPDNETVVSAGADERLCFWKLFEAPYSEKKVTNKSKMFMNDLR